MCQESVARRSESRATIACEHQREALLVNNMQMEVIKSQQQCQIASQVRTCFSWYTSISTLCQESVISNNDNKIIRLEKNIQCLRFQSGENNYGWSVGSVIPWGKFNFFRAWLLCQALLVLNDFSNVTFWTINSLYILLTAYTRISISFYSEKSAKLLSEP